MPTAPKAPGEPDAGLRFDSNKVLLDPYGRGVAMPQRYDREAAVNPGDNAGVAMKSVVLDPREYDWEDDRTVAPSLCRDHHLRDARARLHAPSQLRVYRA
jgi:pullulanase/glycogen debranching enzyme